MVFIKIKLKNKIFAICLSLIAIGCAESPNNNGGGSPPPALTCADDIQICSPPHLTALYYGGELYFKEDTDTNQPIKIREGGKQTFYAVIHDPDILSGESVSIVINSIPINLNTNTADNLNSYFSQVFKRTPENVPSALENYTNADGYEIFIFTLGETLSLDDGVVGEHEVSIIPTDTKGLEGIDDIFKVAVVIENVNDAPVISTLTSLGGVIPAGGNIFEVFEGGDNGTIKVIVDDVDIQHGDIIGLNITDANSLAGVISIEKDKLSQSDAINNREENNQVEFVVHIASGLLQDADIGGYQFQLLVYDELGVVEVMKNITLKVKDTDDASSAKYVGVSGDVRKPDDNLDIFVISEGQSGQIKVAISDEDLIHTSQLGYAITGNSIREGLLNITKVESLSSVEEHIFLIDIGKNDSPIDDVDIGSYNLILEVFNASTAKRVDALYPFVLEINNVLEPTALINVQAGKGAVAGTEANYFVLTEKISASLNIIVMDEDLVNPLTQENITMKILSTDLPNNLLLTKSLYISRPDTVGGNQATFILEIAAPRNEDVRDDNYTIRFIVSGADKRSSVGKISIRIENVNDAPVISSLTHSGGVVSAGGNIFEVFEGGDNGAIKVVVDDEDIQHGDIIGLNITGANSLAGVISIEKDKLSQSNTVNNRVAFIVNIASDLLQDTDIRDYSLNFLVYDELGGVEDERIITLKVKDTDDASSASYSVTSGGINALVNKLDGIPDTFAISEGQSGQIKVAISDEDLIHTSQLEYAITGDPIRKGLLNITRVESLSSAEEHIFLIDIGKNGIPIDDADIGSYNLSLHVADAARTVNANYTFILKVNNVDEQPTIISVLAGTGVSASASDNSWTLTEDIAGSLSIVVEDEDFGSSQNQERLHIAIMSPTLPKDFITIQQSEISYLDSPTNNRVTFSIEFVAPTNELVGVHNITFSFVDTTGNTALYKREFKIENVNDAPSISSLTHSGGVIPAGENIFEVFEGDDNGTIKVIVDDADIQHGDIVSLNISNNALLGDSAFIDKYFSVESNLAAPNQVEFTIHIASELMQDADIGEYLLDFLVYDELGGVEDERIITLKVKDTDDASSASYSVTSGGINALVNKLDGIPDTFAISEGQSGQIEGCNL